MGMAAFNRMRANQPVVETTETEVTAEPVVETTENAVNLDDMTVDELRAYAQEKGIFIPKTVKTHDTILKRIKEG